MVWYRKGVHFLWTEVKAVSVTLRWAASLPLRAMVMSGSEML